MVEVFRKVLKTLSKQNKAKVIINRRYQPRRLWSTVWVQGYSKGRNITRDANTITKGHKVVTSNVLQIYPGFYQGT